MASMQGLVRPRPCVDVAIQCIGTMDSPLREDAAAAVVNRVLLTCTGSAFLGHDGRIARLF